MNSIETSQTGFGLSKEAKPMRLRGCAVRAGRGLSRVVALLSLVFSAVPATRAVADAASLSGVQEYLVPGTQKEMLDVFNQLLADTYGPGRACVSTREGACVTPAMAGWEAYVESRVSVVAYADRTVVLLDDRRNGFASGYDAGGFDDVYELGRGQVVTFGEDGRAERPSQPSGASRFALLGGDRVVTVGGPTVVMRAAWPKWIKLPRGTRSGVTAGQVLADTVTLYPTAAWGSQYGTPMGETAVPDPLRVDDLTTKAIVQAGEDGTVVLLDGVSQNAVPLGRGQSLVLDRVAAGAAIGGASADGAGKPISVSLVTSGRSPVEARFFNLTPQGLLDSSYVLPVNSMTDGDRRSLGVRLYLYAYEPLHYSVYQGTSTTPVAEGTLAGKGTAVHAIGAPTPLARVSSFGRELSAEDSPTLAGALRVVATGRLQVLAAMDSGSADYDWGFSGIGARHLANEYYVPWTPGNGVARGGSTLTRTSRGGHPLFVSPARDQTRIFVDWDPWANDGPETSVVLDAGQWATLVDPEDGDNTGARLYSLRIGGGPEEGGEALPEGMPEGAFAVAWGEGILADRADDQDVGFGLPPQKETCQSLRLLKLVKLAEPERVAPGGEFAITLTLTSDYARIEAVSLADILPNEDFEYVPGSARLFYPGSATGVAAEPKTADGLKLVWDVEDPLSPGDAYTLPPRSRLVVTFTIRVDGAADYGSPLPDTKPNNAEGYGKWCPYKGKPCYELRPTAFDNMRVAEITGSIKVRKIVDWNGTRGHRNTVFRICVKPAAAGAEQCQDLDWNGGVANFRRLPAGEWTVYEKAVLRSGTDVTNEWTVTGSGQVVRIPGKSECSSVEIKNKRKKVGKPSIIVHKVVDWSGTTPDPAQTFTLCVTGGPYAAPTVDNGGCQVVGFEGGTLTWYDLPKGMYVVAENPLPGIQWSVWPKQLTLQVTEGRGKAQESLATCQNEGTIKNKLKPAALGSLKVTKVVNLNGGTADPTTFSICIQGPSYPTTPSCQTIGLAGGTLVWTNLIPGSYTVTEPDPGSSWSVEIAGSPATVTAGSNVTANADMTTGAPPPSPAGDLRPDDPGAA